MFGSSDIWDKSPCQTSVMQSFSDGTRCEICSKLTMKTLERRHWRRSGIFNVTFEHILHLALMFLLLTLSRNVDWVFNGLNRHFFPQKDAS